ncbi:MAG: hypothetical protein ACR2GP_14630 [Burkholderiaceae bacterium]
MHSSTRRSWARLALCFSVAALALSFGFPALAAASGGLRDRFPASSINSAAKADAALAATSGAKQRVEKEYKDAARECVKKFRVNDCLDEARTLRHDRLADIEAIQVEANRFKRRDKADRIEADSAQRERDRAANAAADADLRAKNRRDYDDRQEQAKREAADRARSGRTSATHSPLVGKPKPGSPEANATQRARNAAEQATKVKEAAVHREQLTRRHAEKEADRARRVQQQARKDAEKKAAQTAPTADKP